MRSIVSLSVVSLIALCAAEARGQYPSGYGGYGGAYGGYGAPGLYGSGLSPYLNMRGVGGSAASNYYNFVRPYTGGTFGNAFVPGGYGVPAARQPLFPGARPVYEQDSTTQKLEADKDGIMRADLPPAGHPSGFMNQMGFFGQVGVHPGMGAAAAAGRRPR